MQNSLDHDARIRYVVCMDPLSRAAYPLIDGNCYKCVFTILEVMWKKFIEILQKISVTNYYVISFALWALIVTIFHSVEIYAPIPIYLAFSIFTLFFYFVEFTRADKFIFKRLITQFDYWYGLYKPNFLILRNC